MPSAHAPDGAPPPSPRRPRMGPAPPAPGARRSCARHPEPPPCARPARPGRRCARAVPPTPRPPSSPSVPLRPGLTPGAAFSAAFPPRPSAPRQPASMQGREKGPRAAGAGLQNVTSRQPCQAGGDPRRGMGGARPCARRPRGPDVRHAPRPAGTRKPSAAVPEPAAPGRRPQAASGRGGPRSPARAAGAASPCAARCRDPSDRPRRPRLP